MDNLYIICGLGNPGPKYEDTRHNIGFMTLDKLANDLNVKLNKIKFKGLLGEGKIFDKRFFLLKPQTFMNNSGESLRPLRDFYKIKDENILIIADDIDILFGQIKIKKNGSAGTHNGLKSIVNHLGTKEFPRIKIGVGKKMEGEDLADFVLSKFTPSERKHIDAATNAGAKACIDFLEKGIEKTMNIYNNKIYWGEFWIS